jgi:hypothetical protein
MLAHRPDLAYLDRAGQPNHYRGYGSYGNKELGETILNLEAVSWRR